jgi:hypothetical protein
MIEMRQSDDDVYMPAMADTQQNIQTHTTKEAKQPNIQEY